ncbi:MAG: hypothetical protein ACREVN_13140 [Gammaproteobacteria bacterium]
MTGVIASLLGVSACATARLYEGQARLTEDVAIIQSASRLTVLFSPNPVYVRSVDGRDIAAGVSELVVEPGEHTLVARCRANLIYGSTHTLELDLQAGNTYRLESVANPTTRCSVRVRAE